MFFIFDANNPKTILFYILVILLALIIDHLNIFEIQKTIAVFMLVGILLYLYRIFKDSE